MPVEKLITLTPDKMGSGMYPSAEPLAGETWNTGTNVWFRELSIEQVLGRKKLANLTTASPRRSSQAMQQAFTTDQIKRVFYEDGGVINAVDNPVLGTVSTGSSHITQIASLNSSGDYDLETWGDWLFMTDGTKYTGSGSTGGLQYNKWIPSGSVASGLYQPAVEWG